MRHLVNSILILYICFLAAPLYAEPVQSPESAAIEASVRKLKSTLQAEGTNPVSTAVTQPMESVEEESGIAFRMAKGLGFCLGVLCIGLAIVKRFHPGVVAQGSDDRSMKIVEQLRLSPKACVYLIEVDGKKVLIGSGSEAISMQEISGENAAQKEVHKDVEDVCQEQGQAVVLRRSA